MGVKEAFIEDRTIDSLRRAIDRGLGALSRKIAYGRAPIQNDKIVFMTYSNSYECNPKYIAEKILEQQLPLDLVWIVPQKGAIQYGEFPPEIRIVRRGRSEAFQEMATANIWIDNSLNFEWTSFPKKKDQVYIETWHGSMGLKRVGKDDVADKRWLRAAKRVTRRTDVCISDSTFENKVYRETYWPSTEIWKFGHPRNDILFIDDKDKLFALKAKIANELRFDIDDKVLLYAPTFRDNARRDCFDIDFQRLLDVLEQRFGGNWKILMRFHFHDRTMKVRSRDGASCIVDATSYRDIQELLAITDAGITDYSSWACDYVLTGKPLFIFATDYEEYDIERGLYYPLETTPFPIAHDNDGLMQNIAGFDAELYAERCVQFLQDRGCFEDGHAAERTVHKLIEITGIEV